MGAGDILGGGESSSAGGLKSPWAAGCHNPLGEHMITRHLRWGFLGAAGIARKNWHAIYNSGNSVLAAVASRDGNRAREFIRECQSTVPFPEPPQLFDSYTALLESDTVDAVYIPLPTGVRKEWVLRAARAGKHVVCEKPCAINATDLREMIEACTSRGLQFMDGVMFVHGERMQRIRDLFSEGSSLGEIRRLNSQFSFRADEEFAKTNIRSRHELEPQGCLGDLGWYSLTLGLEVFGGRMPRVVTGKVHSWLGETQGADGVPAEFSGELIYDGGVTASFYCSFVTENQQWAHISGSGGNLYLDDFVLPFFGSETEFEVSRPEFHVTGCRFDMQAHARRIHVQEYSNNHPTAQETQLFRHFADQVLSGCLRPDWPDRALKTQILLDACLASALDGGSPCPVS